MAKQTRTIPYRIILAANQWAEKLNDFQAIDESHRMLPRSEFNGRGGGGGSQCSLTPIERVNYWLSFVTERMCSIFSSPPDNGFFDEWPRY